MEIKDVLTLDDHKDYVIASKTKYEGKDFYYLVEIDNPGNLMFCYEENGDLVVSKDKNLNTKLLPLFLKASKNIFAKPE